MAPINHESCCTSRRDFLRTGFFGLGVGSALPLVFGHTSLVVAASSFFEDNETHPERILVVVELTGGNDGLNTVVPWRDDLYYRSRPTLAIPAKSVLQLNDDIGLHPSLGGMQQLWDKGMLAIVPGCGYPNANLSHFESMDHWHSASPHSAESRGWIGQVADLISPKPKPNFIVNIASKQSLAVKSGLHAPVTFSDPDKFVRVGDPSQAAGYARLIDRGNDSGNPTLAFLTEIASNAEDGSAVVRAAIAKYGTPVDYGVGSLAADLRKVAALIQAGLPTRFYYVNIGGFDNHAGQAGTHRSRLYYVGDALRGFMEDVERIRRGNDVAVMVFSEFGRRLEENASAGTDHGAAGPMFVIGTKVKGGVYSKYPSLTDLDANGNLKMSVDFRRVYATMIKEWIGCHETKAILKGDFPTLGIFA